MLNAFFIFQMTYYHLTAFVNCTQNTKYIDWCNTLICWASRSLRRGRSRGRYWRTVPVRKGEKIEGCTIVSPEAYVTKGCTPAVKISQVPEAEDDMR